METKVRYTVQVICPGTTGDRDSDELSRHDGLHCQGGEWRNEMSAAWPEDTLGQVLAIYREDRPHDHVRMIRNIQEVMDL